MNRLFRLFASAFQLNCKKDYRLKSESDSNSDLFTESSLSSLIQYEDCSSTIDESIVIRHETVNQLELINLPENLVPELAQQNYTENCSVISSIQHESLKQSSELSVNSLIECNNSNDLNNHSNNMSVNIENGSSYPNRYGFFGFYLGFEYKLSLSLLLNQHDFYYL